MTVTVPDPPGDQSASRRRRRAALARVLWDEHGVRRLPRERDLVAAMTACARPDVWWVCEASSAGPVYLLPTREWMRALARLIDELGARTILEVAAGDGMLTHWLSQLRPKLRFIATDSGAWKSARGRMTDRDRREYRGVHFAGVQAAAHVQRMAAVTAVKKFRPDLTIVSWAPPGTLVDRVILASSRPVLDISVDGDVCGNGMRTWRFEKEFLEGPIEARALCRLDERPTQARATRVTLYEGAKRGRRRRRTRNDGETA
jgi:hypothetical protein